MEILLKCQNGIKTLLCMGSVCGGEGCVCGARHGKREHNSGENELGQGFALRAPYGFVLFYLGRFAELLCKLTLRSAF